MGFKGDSNQILKTGLLDEYFLFDDAQREKRHSLVGWSVITHKGFQYRAFYNNSRQIVTQKQQLDSNGNLIDGTIQTVIHTSKTIPDFGDDHKFITLHFFGDILFVFWGMHAEPLQFFRMNAPNSIDVAGATETTLSAITTAGYNQTTYVMCWDNPVNSDEVYLYLRNGTSGNADSRLILYTISTDTFTVPVPSLSASGIFFTKTRAGGTCSMYPPPPFITSDGLAIWVYHIRIDTGGNDQNTDVNILVYDMVLREFRKTDGTVYDNTIQFDAGSNTRKPEKLVDIPTASLLGTDYIRRNNARLKDGTDVMVYQTADANGFRNVFVLRSKNGIPETPKQLTFFDIVDNSTLFRNFINPALYLYAGTCYVVFKDLKNYGQMVVLESSDGCKTFKNPYSISYNAGIGALQNMDIQAWNQYGVFYSLTQEVVNDFVLNDIGRSMHLLRWKPSEGKVLPYLSGQSFIALGDMNVGSRSGNLVLFAGNGEVIKLLSAHHLSELTEHHPSAINDSKILSRIVRTEIDGVSPTVQVITGVEQPTTINGGTLPNDIVFLDFTVEPTPIASGTHKGIDAGTTKVTPTVVDAWIKIRYKDVADGLEKIGNVGVYNSKTS